MLGAIRPSTLQLSSGARTRWVVLLAALHIALCTHPLHAQQTRDRWSDFRLLAQQELEIAEGLLVVESDTDDIFVLVRLAPPHEAMRARFEAELTKVKCGIKDLAAAVPADPTR